MSDTIQVDLSVVGELLASLLDYARILKDDPSAAELIEVRITSISAELDRQGVEWVTLKAHIIEALAFVPVRFTVE